jgi:hypothetical protein
MLGGSPITAVLGSAPPADAETARLKSFAKAATEAGLALMLIAPGTKEPVDVRTPQQRKKDDVAAQEAAREAGRPDWIKARSMAGCYLATTDGALIAKYIDRYRKLYPDSAVNFAIEVGRSRMVVIDADTADQVQAFLADQNITQPVPPTVQTPGARNAAGEWVHADGGHFYFTLPEGVEIPGGSGSYTAPGGWVAMWRDRYVLIPPSVRPEGPYILTGREYPITEPLLNRITEHANIRAARHAEREAGDGGDDLAEGIDAWAESVSWADILAPAGWTLSGRTDRCGCEVWTAPGPHESPKSATTHDTGCELGRYTAVNAPMHVWTYSPGPEFEQWIAAHGTSTITKLQAAAIVSYGGDVGTACAEIGILPEKDSLALEMGTSVSGMLDEITLPEPEVPDRPSCPHGEVTAAGRCTSCGDQVAECTHPNWHRDADGHHFCAVCGKPDEEEEASCDGAWEPHLICEGCDGSAPKAECYQDSDGNWWHTQPGAEDHECGDQGPPWNTSLISPSACPHPTCDPVDPTRCETCGAQIGVPVDDGGPLPSGDLSFDPATALPQADLTAGQEKAESDAADPFADPGGPTEFPAGQQEDTPEEAPDDDVLVSESRGVPRIAPFSYWRDLPAPEYAVEGLIEHRALSCLIGQPGVGKSVVAIDLACSLATGVRWQGRKTLRQRVLYLPGEGLSGAVQRIRAWELAHDKDVSDDLFVGNAIIQLAAAKEDWAEVAQYVLRHRVGLIIFDTFARMSLGLEENSASDVGRAITRFDQIKNLTGAGVLVVHHTGKSSESGRGSSALNGALDSEILIRRGTWDASSAPDDAEPIEMMTTKQKNAARLRDPLPLMLTPMHESVVATGPSGTIGDPLDTMVAAPLAVPEPVVETAIRLREFAERFPVQGVTRGEFVTGVEADEFIKSRKAPEIRWKQSVAEAVDLGLRYNLIETLTGRPTGTRYIVSTTTPEAARRRASEEALTD